MVLFPVGNKLFEYIRLSKYIITYYATLILLTAHANAARMSENGILLPKLF